MRQSLKTYWDKFLIKIVGLFGRRFVMLFILIFFLSINSQFDAESWTSQIVQVAGFFAVIAWIRVASDIKTKALKNIDLYNKYSNKSIAFIMNSRQSRKTLFITITLLTLLLLMNVLIPYLFDNVSVSALTLFIPNFFIITLLVLINFRDEVMRYRIQMGYFGNNEHESRLIIQFVLDNQKNIDFTDGGKGKKIISAEDLKEIESSVLVNKPVFEFQGR
ncbi:hypothetical protein [Thalassomonas haliotis]|uniref:Uncharacterized protein n=1 Tax=Thalassomonas haliotis TaxID=485448 RepID=A0ABY7V957_9GAMM|nr:hypothetical protein [Thalassomonas haliotis]WDE09579.1 hypothetical protein H3N35_14670 [Thalassomonas haliotis]